MYLELVMIQNISEIKQVLNVMSSLYQTNSHPAAWHMQFEVPTSSKTCLPSGTYG